MQCHQQYARTIKFWKVTKSSGNSLRGWDPWDFTDHAVMALVYDVWEALKKYMQVALYRLRRLCVCCVRAHEHIHICISEDTKRKKEGMI